LAVLELFLPELLAISAHVPRVSAAREMLVGS
jgi:hypothetical protein